MHKEWFKGKKIGCYTQWSQEMWKWFSASYVWHVMKNGFTTITLNVKNDMVFFGHAGISKAKSNRQSLWCVNGRISWPWCTMRYSSMHGNASILQTVLFLDTIFSNKCLMASSEQPFTSIYQNAKNREYPQNTSCLSKNCR